jgi:hypothetical protein
MFQLTSGLITETSLPNEYLYVPEINAAIQRYNWTLRASNIPGWTTLVKVINYSS